MNTKWPNITDEWVTRFLAGLPNVCACRWCGGIIDLDPMLEGRSDDAVWGILDTINQHGTLCDSCYARQEAVR